MISAEAEELKQRFADFSAQVLGGGGTPPTLPVMRDLFGTFADITENPAGVAWSEVDAGGVPAIWADADGGTKDRVILYLHGGAYVMGNAHFYKRFTGHLAKAAELVSVER